jgi:hypothetical protein
MVQPMSRLVRLAVLLLAAIWLPVTMHCQIEAAGLLQPHDECAQELSSQSNDTGCKDDACPTVEDALFRESGALPLLFAPADAHSTARLLALLAEGREWSEPVLSVARQAPPAELVTSWQFHTRAAPPARAPGFLNT